MDDVRLGNEGNSRVGTPCRYQRIVSPGDHYVGLGLNDKFLRLI